MKKVKFLLFIAVISISQACNNSGNKDSVAAAKDSNDNAMATHDSSGATMMGRDTSAASTGSAVTAVGKDDADFAVEAADGGMMEVELGNYAQQNAVNPRVKEFGAMMVRDHSKANDELKSIAGIRNGELATA